MIVREFYKKREDGINLYRTYSNKNLKIRQIETGIIYEEAIDVENSIYTYEETEEKNELEIPERNSTIDEMQEENVEKF